MNKTSINLLVVLLVLSGYTMKAEFDHRREIEKKEAKIEIQQAQLQEWRKVKLEIVALQEEHELLREKLNAAKAAAFGCDGRADNTTGEGASDLSAAPAGLKDAQP